MAFMATGMLGGRVSKVAGMLFVGHRDGFRWKSWGGGEGAITINHVSVSRTKDSLLGLGNCCRYEIQYTMQAYSTVLDRGRWIALPQSTSISEEVQYCNVLYCTVIDYSVQIGM